MHVNGETLVFTHSLDVFRQKVRFRHGFGDTLKNEGQSRERCLYSICRLSAGLECLLCEDTVAYPLSAVPTGSDENRAKRFGSCTGQA